MESDTNDDGVPTEPPVKPIDGSATADTDAGPGEGTDGDSSEAPEVWTDEDLLLQIARNTATTKTLAAGLLAIMVVGLVLLGILVVRRTDTSTSVAAATSTTSASGADSSAAAESVAGEPCVATSEPLPAGAPPVDVDEGPPPTDLVIKDLTEGTGTAATATDTVTVNYIVQACSSGKILDSSYKNGSPATIALSQVIPGVSAGITGMMVGGTRLIGIPSDQAYGSTGNPPTIAPDESIWFVVELTGIKPA